MKKSTVSLVERGLTLKHLNKSLIFRVASFLLLELIAVLFVLFLTPPFGRNIPYSVAEEITLVPFRDPIFTSSYVSKQKNENGNTVFHYTNKIDTMIYEIEDLNDGTYFLRYTQVTRDENAENTYINRRFRINLRPPDVFPTSNVQVFRDGAWNSAWVYMREPFELAIFLSLQAASTKRILPRMFGVSIVLSLLVAVIVPLSKLVRFKVTRLVISCAFVLINLLWSARFLL